MLESFEMSDVIPATPQAIYEAWIDGEGHSAITGGPAATAEGQVGGKFTAWDGYIWGSFTALQPGKQIVMAWRTSEFPEDAADSVVEVTLTPTKDGTEITLKHSNIPEGQGEDYRQGWIDFYFTPMKAYFGAA